MYLNTMKGFFLIVKCKDRVSSESSALSAFRSCLLFNAGKFVFKLATFLKQRNFEKKGRTVL
jgi:hypothetical protein